MRICHLVGRSHRRGAEQVALELATELERRGHRNEVRALSFGHEGDAVPELPALVPSTDHRPVTLVRGAWALHRLLRSHPVDVVLAHGAAAAMVAVLASPRRGPAIVWQTIVGMADQSFGPVQVRCWRVAVRRIDGAVALTGPLGAELARLGYRGPVWPIPNARRTERFADLDPTRDRAALRRELGVAEATPLLGLVGYLVPQKQPRRAVELLAQLAEAGNEAHLVIVGSGPLQQDVAALVADLGLEAQVSMLGHRDDVPELLGGLDALVLTSDDEGVPGIVIEAAMAGCPVVTLPIGGVADVVVDGVTGIVTDEASVPALATAVAGLLADPSRRAEMAEQARLRSRRFAMEAVADQYEARLADVAADR